MKKIIIATLCLLSLLIVVDARGTVLAMDSKPGITSISPANSLN